MGVVLWNKSVQEVRPNAVSNNWAVNPRWMGQSVIINPALDWGDREECASDQFHILGMPQNGTLAEYVSVDASRKPEFLSDTEAAALPLAGLTAYRAAVVKAQIKPGQKVLIPGIGSGVATLAAQFAVASGAEVWVTSKQNEKIEKAIQVLKVSGGANYNDKDWVNDLLARAGSFDAIIDGGGGQHFYSLITKLLKSGGKLVTYGATAGLPPTEGKNGQFPLRNIFLQQKSIIGTTMGSDKDFEEMLRFVSVHKIVPLISSIRPFKDVLLAIKQMEAGDHMGKLVLAFPPNSRTNTKAKL